MRSDPPRSGGGEDPRESTLRTCHGRGWKIVHASILSPKNSIATASSSYDANDLNGVAPKRGTKPGGGGAGDARVVAVVVHVDQQRSSPSRAHRRPTLELTERSR